MRTVWKYQIKIMRDTVGTFYVPEGAILVHAAPDVIYPGSLSEPCVSLWFEVESENDAEVRVFEVFGTGHAIPDAAGVHVASVVDAPLVLHVYERTVDVEIRSGS